MTGTVTKTRPLPPADETALPDRMPVEIAVADEISASLIRRGYLTTEWWTTVIAALLSLALGTIGVPGATAAQVTAIGAPVVLATVYAVTRSMHKSTLADLVADTFPKSADSV